MSINGLMRTSVSGMNAQANRLSTVSENIGNASTNGYKRASTEFSSLVLEAGQNEYNSGAVETQVRYNISQQGSTIFTSSKTDAAISGNGFFIVGDDVGKTFLSRAGSFVESQQLAADGTQRTTLQNAAGYRLYGSPITGGDIATADPNQREIISIDKNALTSAPTTVGALAMNLPALAEAVADPTPRPSAGADAAAAAFENSFKTSIIVYDNVGTSRRIDVYATKSVEADLTVDPATGAQWEIAAFDSAMATDGQPPYSEQLGTTVTITFDPMTGRPAAGSATVMEDLDLGAGQTVDLDISALTQLDADFSAKVSADGRPPSRIEQLQIGENGIVNGVFSDGSSVALYRLPLARVSSVDKMTPLAGNVYVETPESGARIYGFADTSGFGEVVGSALEQSNVDLATELTTMIESQRSYSANSKVFQTGSEILDVLVNLKR